MKEIRSVLIDDEQSSQVVLEKMLEKYCPEVLVCAKAGSAMQGFEVINKVKPDLVFLDIKMPGKTGFEMLRMFEQVNFHVIFVSAHDEYAIQAFDYNAMDYVLKPIDHDKLVRAVKKIEQKISSEQENNIIHFIHGIDESRRLIENISFHQNQKVHIVKIANICFIEATGRYSEVITTDKQRFVSAKTLTNYEELLKQYPNFVRVNKGMIINANYVTQYTKGSTCSISLANYDEEIEVSRRRKAEIIKYLKQRLG